MEYKVQIERDLEPVIPQFIANRKKDMEDMKDAIDKNDIEHVRQIGHSLKGVGSGYGFLGITELGSAIEMAAKELNMKQIVALHMELEYYLDHIEIVYIDVQ